jgi:ABC-type dipeptide/oligopeptide/nickel transport system ATPase component
MRQRAMIAVPSLTMELCWLMADQGVRCLVQAQILYLLRELQGGWAWP